MNSYQEDVSKWGSGVVERARVAFVAEVVAPRVSTLPRLCYC